MDVHGPGKIRRPRIIQPVIVSEPRVRIRHGNQIARALVINTGGDFFRLAQHGIHASSLAQYIANLILQGHIIKINMRHLMIRHGEHPAGPGIENFPPQLILHRQPAAFPKNPVQVDGIVHIRNAIFREQHHRNAPSRKEINQPAHQRIHFAQVAIDFGIQPAVRSVWPMPLQVVIQMRQVNQIERRRVCLFNPFGRLRNPARRGIRLALR